jgi:hypothetical protein
MDLRIPKQGVRMPDLEQRRSRPSGCIARHTIAISAIALGVCYPSNGPAQVPLPAADSVRSLYRPPTLLLVQPAPNRTVPQDRPTIVFRFAPGEPADPIDARSLVVTVDGEDRSALFQIAAIEAWGPLAPPATESTPAIAPGGHLVAARICSVRGACGETSAMVTVTAAAEAPQRPSVERKRTLIDLLLLAARKLITP